MATLDTSLFQVVDGYFVHFFAPPSLDSASKSVLFILDVSGSMRGTKIKQMKDAITVILDQLHPHDYFNIIKFASSTSYWKQQLVSADSSHITEAQTWIKTLIAKGGDHIAIVFI